MRARWNMLPTPVRSYAGVDVVDPVHARPVAIAAIRHDPRIVGPKPLCPALSDPLQEWFAEQVRVQRPRCRVTDHVRAAGNVAADPMRDDVDVVSATGEERGQRKVRAVLSAGRDERGGDEQPRRRPFRPARQA